MELWEEDGRHYRNATVSFGLAFVLSATVTTVMIIVVIRSKLRLERPHRAPLRN